MKGKFEISRKPLGQVVKDVLDQKGISHKVTINQDSRIVVFLEQDVTQGDINGFKNGLPAWFKYFYDVEFVEVE